jgi:hypothetical protein
MDETASPCVERGETVPVLEAFSTRFPRLSLYDPQRRQAPPPPPRTDRLSALLQQALTPPADTDTGSGKRTPI